MPRFCYNRGIKLELESPKYTSACSKDQMIRSYPGKSMIVSEFESSRGTTWRNQRRTRNKI